MGGFNVDGGLFLCLLTSGRTSLFGGGIAAPAPVTAPSGGAIALLWSTISSPLSASEVGVNCLGSVGILAFAPFSAGPWVFRGAPVERREVWSFLGDLTR